MPSTHKPKSKSVPNFDAKTMPTKPWSIQSKVRICIKNEYSCKYEFRWIQPVFDVEFPNSRTEKNKEALEKNKWSENHDKVC